MGDRSPIGEGYVSANIKTDKLGLNSDKLCFPLLIDCFPTVFRASNSENRKYLDLEYNKGSICTPSLA